MSDQEYDRYCQYMEEKEDAELWDAMYGDPCTCEWRDLRYGRVCVRRLCEHCKEGIANSKRIRASMRGVRHYVFPWTDADGHHHGGRL